MIQRLGLPVLALTALIALIVGVFAGRYANRSSDGSSNVIAATVLAKPRDMTTFDLVDHNGLPFDRNRLKQGWSLMFFGFTNCPDICPTTLHTLKQVGEQLQENPADQQLRVIFVSVDPMRDTPKVMAEYLQFIDDRVIGVTGPLPALQPLTNDLGVAFGYTADDQGNYSVDHTAALFLIGPEARLRAVFQPPHSAEQIAADFRQIVAKTGG